MPDKGWHRAFDDPISLPRGGELVTLTRCRELQNQAAQESTKPPPKWEAAIRALMLVVEHHRQMLLARIGMMRR